MAAVGRLLDDRSNSSENTALYEARRRGRVLVCVIHHPTRRDCDCQTLGGGEIIPVTEKLETDRVDLTVLGGMPPDIAPDLAVETGVSPISSSPIATPIVRLGMLNHLVDAANLITLFGLALAFLACWAVLTGQPAVALALAALAIVIDNVDGWMARRTLNRNPAFEHFGKHLDCYADFICKGVFPVLYLLTATDMQIASLPVALIYLAAIAVRYCYEFVPDRGHIGLSPDYVIAFLCLLQLAAPHMGSAFIPTLMASLVGFAALAVAPFPSPKLKGGAIVGFCIFLLVLAAVLLTVS